MALWYLLSILWVWVVIMLLECLVCAWQGCWCQGCSSKWPRHSSSFMELVLHQLGHFEKYKDIPGGEEILASRSPIRIASCGLFLCSVRERVHHWPEHWKPVWALLFGKLIKPQVPHWGVLYQNLQCSLSVADCNKIASQPSSQSVFTK